MPGSYNTKASALGVGGSNNASITVTIIGLKDLQASLRRLSPEADKELKREMREAGNLVLSKTRSYASVLGKAPTGAYAGSFSMKNLAAGVRIQSGDPGAGTIEFANKGAVYLRGPRRGMPIGTPANSKPKAFIKAANEQEPLVIAKVEAALQNVCDKVRGA